MLMLMIKWKMGKILLQIPEFDWSGVRWLFRRPVWNFQRLLYLKWISFFRTTSWKSIVKLFFVKACCFVCIIYIFARRHMINDIKQCSKDVFDSYAETWKPIRLTLSSVPQNKLLYWLVKVIPREYVTYNRTAEVYNRMSWHKYFKTASLCEKAVPPTRIRAGHRPLDNA